jgi:autotransporter-associated beta strand protein
MKFQRVLPSLLLSMVLLFFFALHAHAGSDTCSMNPTSGDWNTANNWTPPTVPNGPTDTATFDVSDTTDVTPSASSTEVAEIVFNPSANSFNINAAAGSTGHDVTLTISGAGVENNSDVTQNFTMGPTTNGHVGTLHFKNTATAGTNTTYTAYGNSSPSNGALFLHTSSAGSATFIAEGATSGLDVSGGYFIFYDNSTAENANFTINPAQNNGGFGGSVGFSDFATAGSAVFVLNPGMGSQLDSGSMGFSGNATAGNGVFTLNGATICCTRTEISFGDAATAGNGFFTNHGGQQPGAFGGEVLFSGYTFTGLITTAGNATIINEGGKGAGSIGGATDFGTAATGGQALLVANGGEDGGGPGHISFGGEGDGGEAQIEVYGDGYLDISYRLTPSVTIGSLAGDGFVYLGLNNLTVGSNNLDTTFSGTIKELGGIGRGTHGSLTKIGTGQLTLSGESTYTAGTIIGDGVLKVNNATGSATGTKAVEVNAGTLAGKGIIAGTVTVGTGSGTGAFLAPGGGSQKDEYPHDPERAHDQSRWDLQLQTQNEKKRSRSGDCYWSHDCERRAV